MAGNKKAVVTGGAGFIGSHVVEAYLDEGYAVTVIDDLSSGRRENLSAEVELVVCDVESDEAQEVVAGGGFSVLNHHAAQMDVRISVTDPALDARINIMGLINVLEGARKGGVERVVFASSGGVVYGESEDLPHDELAPKLPVSPYGVSKLSSEFYLCAYGILHGLNSVSLRYANVYGPRQSPHGEAGVVAIFGKRIKTSGEITIFGDGEQTRDYVFVRDVARANMAATKWTSPGFNSIDTAAFNVGTATETSVNELARAMLEASGGDSEISYAEARAGELQRSSVSFEKARSVLDWSPSVSLLEGLKVTYDWIAGVEE